MLHACVERFDVIGVRENILSWDGEVNKAKAKVISFIKHPTKLGGGVGSGAVTTATAALAVAPDPTIQQRFNVHDKPDMTSVTW
jgi:hypothetical protein